MRWLLHPRRLPYIVYIALALLILLPLLGKGYILALDMVFTPTLRMPAAITNAYPFYALLHALNWVLPAFVIQKVLLFGTFLAAGLGAHYMVMRLRPAAVSTQAWLAGAYVAGVFYICNPFVYTRLMAGQYLVLIGYALLPWALRWAWELLDKPGKRAALWLSGVTLLIGFTSVHTLGLLAILLACLASAQGWRHRHDKAWLGAIAKYAAVTIGAVVVLNSFWLVPLAQGKGVLSDTVAQFTSRDDRAFATTAGHLGLVGNVLSLQGFWGDARSLYLLPSDDFGWWWTPIVLMWLLVAIGVWQSWRQRQRALTVALIVMATVGLVLTVGIAGTIFAPLNRTLLDHMPLFAGYREPQKFAALIALAYAYFGAAGVSYIWYKLYDTSHRQALTLAGVLVAMACAPLLFWGGAGQLRSSEYPAGWYQVNAALRQADTDGSKVLFLPWHLYMPYSFSSGITATPARAFFDVPVLASTDPEIGQAAGYATGSLQQRVDMFVHQAADDSQFAAHAQALGIHYVLLAKEFDYKTYAYLDHIPGVTRYMTTNDLIMYRIERSTP